MRVSGVKDAGFAVSARTNSPRVFLRLGFQRYAASAEEAIKLARQLLAAVDALREGREFTESHTPQDGGGDAS